MDAIVFKERGTNQIPNRAVGPGQEGCFKGVFRGCESGAYRGGLKGIRRGSAAHEPPPDDSSLGAHLVRSMSSLAKGSFRFQTRRGRVHRVIHLRHVPNSRVPLPWVQPVAVRRQTRREKVAVPLEVEGGAHQNDARLAVPPVAQQLLHTRQHLRVAKLVSGETVRHRARASPSPRGSDHPLARSAFGGGGSSWWVSVTRERPPRDSAALIP
eukprot:1183096-Prorocentrum_minimum.AAC.1